MTLQQFKQKDCSRFVEPSIPICFDFCGEFEPHPQPTDNIAHVEQVRPMTAADSNGLSVQDSKDLHELRNMDQLHKQDAVAKMHDRSTKLRAKLKEDGTANFPKHYKK